jgi:hypothetical protein
VRAIIVAVFAAALLFATGADARGGSGGHSSSSHSSESHASSHSYTPGSAKEAAHAETHAASNTVHGSSSAAHSSSPTNYTPTSKRAAQGVARDSHGRIARSEKAKDDFKHSHPCPSTGKGSGACPGYVIDHVQALKHGGADRPNNMQWETVQQAKIKDRTE